MMINFQTGIMCYKAGEHWEWCAWMHSKHNIAPHSHGNGYATAQKLNSSTIKGLIGTIVGMKFEVEIMEPRVFITNGSGRHSHQHPWQKQRLVIITLSRERNWPYERNYHQAIHTHLQDPWASCAALQLAHWRIIWCIRYVDGRDVLLDQRQLHAYKGLDKGQDCGNRHVRSREKRVDQMWHSMP